MAWVGVALAVVHNQDDALELAQETFVRAFENLKNFESRSSFSTWLYRIAANLSIDFWRREGRYSVLRGEDAENELRRLPSSGCPPCGWTRATCSSPTRSIRVRRPI